jgi:hypothetical protein
MIALLFGMVITGSIALVAAFRKREAHKLTFEPVTLSIIFFVSCSIVFCKVASEQIRGEAFLIAQIANSDFSFTKHTLQLRPSGKYIIQVHEIEWVCSYTGRFTIAGDTLILNNTIAAETDSNFVDRYFVNGDKLVPIRNNVEFLDTMRRPWHLQILKQR